jgi:hypothetical protein
MGVVPLSAKRPFQGTATRCKPAESAGVIPVQVDFASGKASETTVSSGQTESLKPSKSGPL